MQQSMKQARIAKQKILDLIDTNPDLKMASPAVGIALLPGGMGIKVSLAAPIEAASILPDMIDGLPVRVDVTGRPAKLD
jgi:hypothetical protein